MRDELKEGQISFSKASLSDLQAIIVKGYGAKELLVSGSCFADFVVPELEKELRDLKDGLVWGPGTTENTNEKIALDRVWKSGILLGVSRVWGVINRLKNEGAEAQKELDTRLKNEGAEA